MKSICTVTLVILCTALFITLDAAPVLPPGYESEDVGEQQFDKMAKTFQNVFSKNLTISIDGIQADNELGKNFASNLLSAVSKKPNPNDDLQETLYHEFNPILSFIGKQLDECGEIQSGDKLMQTVINLFGTFLSGVMKKLNNGVQSRNESDKELGQTLLNNDVINNFLSAISDKHNEEHMQTFIKEFKSLLSEIDNLPAESINPDPNDEMAQIGFKGFKTGLTLLRKLFEDLDGGENQSSEEPVLINLLSRSDELLDLTDAVTQTCINIFKEMVSALHRNVDPKNEAEKGIFDAIDTIISLLDKSLGNGGDDDDDEFMEVFMKLVMNTTFSYIKMKEVENDKIQSTDETVPTFLNLFSNILSVASQMIDPNDESYQIQSDIDIELLKTLLNLFGTVGSALQKKVNPKDELVQILLTLFNTWISGTKNGIGGAQEVQVDTLPTCTYTTQYFDQRMLESMDKKAAMVEADMHLTDEAKIQLWGAILGSLASHMLNKATDG